MKLMKFVLPALLLAALVDGYAQTPCEQLRSLKLGDATITSSAAIVAGPFQNPAAPQGQAPAGAMLPAHCRVAATLTPSSDSDIKVEVWLPFREAWNGKYLAVGGGGFVGSISYGAMATALQEGYATSSTDTGHVGGTANFAVGHPEKMVDFA